MAEKKEYVKLWLSYESYFEAFSDVEVGRLVRAMIQYRVSREEPKFNGNERFIWPAIRRDIDESLQAQEAVSSARSEAGKQGGRPKTKKANAFEESKKSYGQGQGQGQGQGSGQGHYPPTPLPGEEQARGPDFALVLEYAKIQRSEELAKPFFDYYAAANWRDSENKPVYNWQQKFIAWRQREEQRRKSQPVKGMKIFESQPDNTSDILARMKRAAERIKEG